MMACRKIGGVVPLIPNIGIRRRWVANFTHWPHYPRERTPIPI